VAERDGSCIVDAQHAALAVHLLVALRSESLRGHLDGSAPFVDVEPLEFDSGVCEHCVRRAEKVRGSLGLSRERREPSQPRSPPASPSGSTRGKKAATIAVM
jgi:hypothetical protein